MYHYDKNDDYTPSCGCSSNHIDSDAANNDIPVGQERALFSSWFLTCCGWDNIVPTYEERERAMAAWYPGKAPADAATELKARRKATAAAAGVTEPAAS